MQSVDLLAKLLAMENLSVVRTNSHTASFDIVGRVLSLPQWKEMTPEVEEMLVLHEVGHALFTSEKDYLEPLRESPNHRTLMQYANVIEDVRIEKKMKERYAGARRSFFIGYKILNDRDFFGVKTMDMSALTLIDKINLYYKVGYNCGVTFDASERDYIRRIDQITSPQEVISLAIEIYEHAKKANTEKLNKVIFDDLDDNPYEDYDEDEDDFDDMFNSSESDEDEDDESVEGDNSTGAGDLGEVDNSLESHTQKIFDSKLNELADNDVVFKYTHPKLLFTVNDSNYSPIIGYKKLISDIEEYHSTVNYILYKENDVMLDNMVSYLIKEFEMKKSATAYRYAKISKLGQLDSRKLYSYKTKDDIFKQVTRLQDGKNHGMLFLLDWSGSMQNYIADVVEQTISLALFCYRSKIPFQVLAFTDRAGDVSLNPTLLKLRNSGMQPFNFCKEGTGCMQKFSLLELFSHKMSNTDFRKMMTFLSKDNIHRLPDHMRLNGTPLNDALSYMVDYVGEFIKSYAVEKMNFITLTDGESYSADVYNDRNGPYGKKIKFIMKDPITKKDYDYSATNSTVQTNALLSVIRDRYSANSLGFFVVKNSSNEIRRFFHNNTIIDDVSVMQNTMYNARVNLRQDGYVIFNNIPGRNEYYLLDSKKLEVQNGDIDNLNSESNSRQIAKSFSKVMNTRKTSRVVLNSFISQIA